MKLGHYIRLPTLGAADEEGEQPEDAAAELKTILDQKNFLEEHNEQLRANVTNLEKRIAQLESVRGFRPRSPLKAVNLSLQAGQ